MKKKVESYLKTSKNIYHTHALAELLDLEGAEGVGVFSVITHELSMRPNGIGYFKNLRIVAALIHRSVRFVEHIIRDYGLFYIKGDCFQSKLLCQTMVIESILDADNMEENSDEAGTASKKAKRKQGKAVTASERIAINSERVATKSERVATKQQQSRKVPPINSRTHDKDDKDNKYYKDYKKTTTNVEKKTGVGAEDFHSVIRNIFEDEEWLTKVEQELGLKVSSDKGIRDFAGNKFDSHVELTGAYDDGTGEFNTARAKRFFTFWMKPGRNTRKEFDLQLLQFNESRRRGAVFVNIPDIAEDFLHRRSTIETVDEEGNRRGPHGEWVHPHALPCPGKNYRFSREQLKWI